jgi:His-Xaa-Ser system radical SAM maturase HxsB
MKENARALTLNNPELAPVRFRRLGTNYLITNDVGAYAFLTPEQFEALLAGAIEPASELHAELRAKGFLLEPGVVEELEARYARRNAHLFASPLLHIVIATLRCNQKCVYCQAGRRNMKNVEFDMSLETAQKTVDVIFQSPSPSLTIEFQGGEPLANFDTVRYVIEYARKKNETAPRELYFTLVTNLSLMTDEILEFLLDEGVMICTSLDGPAELHDANRPMSGASSHELTVEWMKRINEAYNARGLDPELAFVNALVTVSKRTLKHGPEVVDEYVKHGLKVVHLRPIQPFGFADRTWLGQSYSAEAFTKFYIDVVNYIIELNRKGVEIMEKGAALFLTRMLTDDNPNYMDLRSPCGAGIGQLAYNHDGRVFTCDEARMVSAMGDDIFCIGNVHETNYEEIIRNEGVRTLCSASCLDGLPGCADCAYNPYCGVCPVYSYVTQGDIFGVQPLCTRCKIQMGVQDYLFGLLEQGGPETEALLRRWTIERDRSSVYRRRD